MSLETLALVAFVLAAIPAAFYFLNLAIYRPLQTPRERPVTPISILIPARNEERNIQATLQAVLANTGCEFEVIVLDDHSTDRTAELVGRFHDPRLRIENAPPLPAGWCGKQHACHVLARLARHPLLLFIDADVRLAPDALSRFAHFMEKRPRIALASGVPYQELGSFSEKLLLPLIHTILLGFLPLSAMRRTRWAPLSAGCGQLFVARKDAYESCGGHAQIKDSLHDGIKLPRTFRRAGFATDLFDATDLAVCRMYRGHSETWRGLEKNATEGLAAPGTIVPMTVLLLGGQVLPLALLMMRPSLWPSILPAVLAIFLPRLFSCVKFKQPLASALLHPLGICALLFIQWRALLKRFRGQPSEWKGRKYSALKYSSILLLALATLAGPTNAPSTIELRDQFDVPQKINFPAPRPVILTLADRKGSDQVSEWVRSLKNHCAGLADFRGIAEVSAVPRLLQGHIRKKFQETQKYPVLMDWSGSICEKLEYRSGVANILIIDQDGHILARYEGPVRQDQVASAAALLNRLQNKTP